MSESKRTPALDDNLKQISEEGVENRREQVLLWAIRSRFEVGEADSYAGVLDPAYTHAATRVDALGVVTRNEIETPAYVLYNTDGKLLAREVETLVTALASQQDYVGTIRAHSAQTRSALASITPRQSAKVPSHFILAICDGEISSSLRAKLAEQVTGAPGIELEIMDLRFMDSLAAAVSASAQSMPNVSIKVDPDKVLDLGMEHGAIVFAVEAEQIAKWPGIEDRRLFDLNVRYGLGLNKVRKSLDKALSDPSSSENFIAYHNGLTAICSSFRISHDSIEVEGLSVVNGAQTVVAIHANAQSLTPGLRVLLKLITATPHGELANNIAVRSNTQNPVTSRNLRALDDVQARLESDLAEYGYVYLRKPSAQEPAGKVIRNDDVAQLLCSIYARKPALAVKRQALFEMPLYAEIFPSEIAAEKLIFAHTLRAEVESQKEKAPDSYRRAWALTALTMLNMAAEAIRDDRAAHATLENPEAAVDDIAALKSLMSPFVDAAARVLQQRHRHLADERQPDEFKVAFKQTRTLSDLAASTSSILRSGAQEQSW